MTYEAIATEEAKLVNEDPSMEKKGFKHFILLAVPLALTFFVLARHVYEPLSSDVSPYKTGVWEPDEYGCYPGPYNYLCKDAAQARGASLLGSNAEQP